MKCDSCGNELSSNYPFCPSCGKTLDAHQQDYIYNKQRRKLLLTCITFLLIIIFGGIILINPSTSNLSNNRLAKKELPGRTIMIYMVGSNLETELGLGTRDLNGIDFDQVSSNDTHILLMAGGTKNWYNDYINTKSTCIYELTSNGYEVVSDQGLISMGNPSTLTTFLNYSYNKYKTGKYDLIIWDHGGAVDGSSYDELFREGSSKDNLKLYELTTALNNSPFNKNNKIETVLYRTCLNSTIETANAINDYANYMIGSEEITLGLNFGPSVLSFLNDVKKDTPSIEYGKKYIDGYKDIVDTYCSTYKAKECAGITYSIIDLNNIENLNKKIDKYFSNVNKDLNTNFAQISRMRASSRQYAITEDSNYDMIDLSQLVDNLSTITEDGSKELLDELNKTIKYNYTNDSISKGISIYMPYSYKSYFINTYNSIEMPYYYKTFVTNFYNLKNNYKVGNLSLNINDDTFKKDELGNANISIDLTEDEASNYAAGKYIIFADMGDNLYKPVFASNDVTLNDNKLNANIDGKMVQICSDESCYWLLVNETKKENNSLILTATGVLSKFNSIEDYKIDAVEFTILIDEENPNGKIISVNKILNNQDNLEIGEIRLDLNDYSTLEIATQYYKITDDEGNYVKEWQGNGIYRGQEFKVDNFRFERKDFNDGTRYVAVMGFIDVAGNITWSNLMELK